MRHLLVLIVAVTTACSGSAGRDAAPCTIDSSVSPALLRCPDGTSTPITGAPGNDGSSCTVVDNGDGTRRITCEDGTSVVVSDGQNGENGANGETGQAGMNGDSGANGSSCSAVDNGDGTVTVSCTNGTSATVDTGVGLAPGTVVGIARYYGRNDGGGIKVELDDGEQSTDTDDSGAWSLLDVPPGVHTLRFSAPPYADHLSESFTVLTGTFTAPPVVLSVGRRMFAAEGVSALGQPRGVYSLYRTAVGVAAWNEVSGRTFVADGWDTGELDAASRTVTLSQFSSSEIAVLDLDDGSITHLGDEAVTKGAEASGLLFFRETHPTLPIGQIVQWRTSSRQLHVLVSDVLHTVIVDDGYLYAWGIGAPPITLTQVNLSSGAVATTPVTRAPYEVKRLASGDVMIVDPDTWVWRPSTGAMALHGRQGVASPDGRSIAYLVDMPAAATLRWLNLDDGMAITLDADVYTFKFSPDSSTLAALSSFGATGTLTLHRYGMSSIPLGPDVNEQYEFAERYLRYQVLVGADTHVHLYELGGSDHDLGASAWRFVATGDYLYMAGPTLRLFRPSDASTMVLGQYVTNYYGFTEQHVTWSQQPSGGPLSQHVADLTAATVTPIELVALTGDDYAQPQGASTDKSLIVYSVVHDTASSSMFVYDVGAGTSYPVLENDRPSMPSFVGNTLLFMKVVGTDMGDYGPYVAWTGPGQPLIPLTSISDMMSGVTVQGSIAAVGDSQFFEGGRVTVWDSTLGRATRLAAGAAMMWVMIDEASRTVVYERDPTAGYGRVELVDVDTREVLPLARSGRPLRVLPGGVVYARQSGTFPDLQDNGLYFIERLD